MPETKERLSILDFCSFRFPFVAADLLSSGVKEITEILFMKEKLKDEPLSAIRRSEVDSVVKKEDKKEEDKKEETSQKESEIIDNTKNAPNPKVDEETEHKQSKKVKDDIKEISKSLNETSQEIKVNTALEKKEDNKM